MVNELHEPGELMTAAQQIADKIASNSPTAVQAVKRAVHLGEGQPIEQAIAIMMDAHWRSAVHPDRVEGIGAFNDGREPTFARLRLLSTDSASPCPRRLNSMTVADDLEAARAALVMINPAPYNAEAPPAALVGDITPTELHYVRSNFAVPDHDGTLEIGGAVGTPDDPDPRRPARDAGPRPHRHPRVRRQRAPGDEAAADRRTLGRLRRLHGPLDRCPAARGAGEGRAGGGRGRGPRPGRRPRALPPPGDPPRDRPGQPHLHPVPAARAGHRPGVGDPHRLRDERPAARAATTAPRSG